jgi:hypothetical protein
MYETHPIFISPSDRNVKIWRYLDIAKYLSLLEKKSLFFTRSDLLGDPFEGSLPSTKGQNNLNEVAKRQSAKLLGLSSDQIAFPYSVHDVIRKRLFICSFHMNDYESAALWSIYTKAMQGVAIQSTFSRLCDCFKEYSENNVFIGVMNYIDYNTEIIPISENVFPPLLHKRKSFEHEKELRAVIIHPKEFYSKHRAGKHDEFNGGDQTGLDIKVDLNILIERIYVAPTTDKWVKELLVSVTKKYGIDKPIEQSSLDDSPII